MNLFYHVSLLGFLELNNIQQVYHARQKELADREIETNKLKASNKQLKVTLLKALIERDELMTKKLDIMTSVERLTNQLENMERESDELLRGDQTDHICERYSIDAQVSLLNKIQDARNKLIKNGFPVPFFA